MNFEAQRERMVQTQLIPRGIRDPLVLRAMGKVPREEFVPENARQAAYYDSALSIAEGQTISQPYIVALMTEALELEGGERVLEIGTGSGYQAAVLAEIAGQVYTLERVAALAGKAEEILARLGTATSISKSSTAHSAGSSIRRMRPSSSLPAPRMSPRPSLVSLRKEDASSFRWVTVQARFFSRYERQRAGP